MRCLWTMGTLLLVGASLSAQDKDPKGDDQRKTYAWFRTLGYPDIGKLKFVRVYRGTWSRSGAQPPRAVPDYGFLLADDTDTFRVFLLDLNTETFRKSGLETEPHLRVAYGPASLDAPEIVHSGYRSTQRVRQFVASYACAQRDMPEIAAKLWKHVGPGEFVRNDIAGDTLRILCADLADPDRSFRAHLEAFRLWNRHFKDAELDCWDVEGSASEYIPMLERMAADEAARRKDPPLPIEQMKPEQRVKELIFRLRYARDPYVYRDAPDRDPVEILAKEGLTAVPAMLAGINDSTLTRRIEWGYHRVFKAWHRPSLTNETVGDLTRKALEKIAGRDLKDEKEARRWLAEVEVKGEQQVLIDGVVAGVRGSLEGARILARKYPDAAVPALIRAIRNADEWGQRWLIAELGKLKDPAVEEFLLEQTRTGKGTGAAWELVRRGQFEGVKPIFKRWQEGSDDEALANFLLHCGSPEAVRAVAREFAERWVRDRIDLVASVLSGREIALMHTPSAPMGRAWKPSAEYKAALEAFLAGALFDTGCQENLSAFWNGHRFNSPRVCDVAATALAIHFPDRYRFDSAASRTRKERQHILMANVWRAENGLKPLPVPDPLRVSELPESEAAKLLAQLRAAEGEDARAEAIAAIESRGLAALGTVLRWQREGELEEGTARRLGALAKRIACHVAKIVIDEKGAKPDAALKKVLDGLRERPLTGKAFIGIVLQTTRSLPEGAKGVELSAVREEAGGFVISVRLFEKPYVSGYSSRISWNYKKRLTVGRRIGFGLNRGTCSLDHGRSDECWAEFASQIDEALTASPTTLIEAGITIGLDR